jgi:beta-lactamase class D
VVLDPRTGEILAAVSLPSYDPNLFVPSISQQNLEVMLKDLEQNWGGMLKDLDHPLLNRCVRGFAPGSTYKLLTGLAGGAAGISGQKFNCAGSVTYGNIVMPCWKQQQDGGGHGVLGMSEALAASCGCFWYQIGNAAGIEQIESMGRKIGFGSVYGISDHEDAGILPSPTWLKQHRPWEKWSNGYTANTSIGQGMVLATPLQMAVLAATVGNGGKVPQPGIVKQDGESSWRADLIEGTLTAAAVGQLREGMRLVVNGDFAGKAARSDKVVIAGKTGTAQNWRRDANGARQEDNHGWFIGFAPFENPSLAFAIIKNGARSGGGDCGPIAKRIVEEALALPVDGSGEVRPVGDAAGDAREKAEAQRSAFDAKAATISRAIQQAKPDAKANFVLSELKIGHGEVTLHGTASGMIQALEFRANLVKIGDQFEIEWEFPVPKTMRDGKRVEFQARGSFRPAVKEEKGVTGQTEKLSSPDPAERLKQMAVSAWNTVRLGAALPELPVGAVIQPPPPDSSADGPKPRGAFTAPREEALLWLRKSLRHESGQLHAWPTKPQPFKTNYRIHKGEIIATSQDGENVHIYVWLENPLPDLFRRKIMEAARSQDAEIRVHLEDEKNWQILQRRGALADLPPETTMRSVPENEKVAIAEVQIHFTAPKAAVQKWLNASVEQATIDQAERLARPSSNKRLYLVRGKCWIQTDWQNGKPMQVAVWNAGYMTLLAD